jgi:hypothetical protein
MKMVRVELENCYGIRSLCAELDFSKKNALAIYAPNGVMKTSLARTFADLSQGELSRDRIFPDRVTKREIKDESGADLLAHDVVVIQPYDEQLGPTETTSTLLVDAKLRAEYEGLQATIDTAKTALLDALKGQSGSRKDLEKELSATFTSDDESFFTALVRIQDELRVQTDAPFADVTYDVIFDEKVVELLKTKEFRVAVADYVKRYNELLDSSTYFSRQTFNYFNAATITKSLADNGFFDAKHSVRLNAGSSVEVNTQKELQEIIDAEKQKISNDPDLRKKFAEVEKQITRNVNVRAFHAYLSDHEELLPELENIDRFREAIWKSYLKSQMTLYEVVVDEYKNAEKRKKEIEADAAGQRTQWEEVIDTFNDRFFVPFRLKPKNREKVMLGQEALLGLGFEFEDGDEKADVEKSSLLEVLSTGEKKALYILNVLFEIETRRSKKGNTLFVIDDIADSFDYKNKYAIIQYLKDVAEEPKFRQIILTHNFDFFRTVESRFVGYRQCLMAQKNESSISLVQAAGIKNPFINDWKGHFFDEPMKRIASIPFLRNILEYTKGDQDPGYGVLTSLLHWKTGSADISQNELDQLFTSTFSDQGSWANPDESVVEEIHRQAELCLTADASINFDNKIVMSIAIRLSAEKYMVDQLGDPTVTDGIDANQGPVLLKMFRDSANATDKAVRVLESVMLMTPENIHVNSFMYEPILDMSDAHLRQLYRDIVALSVGA